MRHELLLFGKIYKAQKDIFTPPIRMTESCGHDFCHRCILKIIMDQTEWHCPECRTVQLKQADELVRNRRVEKAVEAFCARNQNETTSYCSHHNLEFALCE